MNKPLQLSNRTRNLHASPIREILSVINRPGMISFAGGLPAAETFPDWSAIELPKHCLQYGASEGETALREKVAGEMASLGIICQPEQVLIISGSQQGIDLVGKLFIDEGTPVAVESPTYLAALQVFRYFGARFLPFTPSHPESLSGDLPAFLYAIPTFQNPTGHCYSREERQALAALCDERNIVLFEDDPYRDLCYDPCERTPICALLKHAPWIYQGSYSKSLAPGLRLGFIVASPELIPLLTRLKQAADLHSSRISQWLALSQLNDPDRQQRMQFLVDKYRGRRDAFARQLEKHLAGLATWSLPSGGLFFWLTLSKTCDTQRLLAEAIERGVAFMPGEAFFPPGVPTRSTLRLNFSHANEGEAERGLAILAELLRTA